MKKLLYILLVLAAGLSATSCRRAVEKARRNIRIEAVERVERHGLTAADVVVRVANGTPYKLLLSEASIDLYHGSGRAGTVELREGVEVPRRTTQSVVTRWQLKISDPLALYVLAKKFREGDLSQVSVSFRLRGRGGPAPVNISRERVPLSEFLNIFGIGMQDLKNYLIE